MTKVLSMKNIAPPLNSYNFSDPANWDTLNWEPKLRFVFKYTTWSSLGYFAFRDWSWQVHLFKQIYTNFYFPKSEHGIKISYKKQMFSRCCPWCKGNLMVKFGNSETPMDREGPKNKSKTLKNGSGRCHKWTLTSHLDLLTGNLLTKALNLYFFPPNESRQTLFVPPGLKHNRLNVQGIQPLFRGVRHDCGTLYTKLSTSSDAWYFPKWKVVAQNHVMIFQKNIYLQRTWFILL